MNWCDERYVRLYTRDTADFLALSFEAQALLTLILRKLDRAGVLELGKHGRRAVAIAVGHAGRWGVLEPALEELLVDGCVVLDGNRLVMPNYLSAQEAVQSDRVRKAESRARRRELVGEVANTPVTHRDGESQNVTESHARSRAVTDGHARSQMVTPCLAVPSLAVPSQCASGEAEPLILIPSTTSSRFDFDVLYAKYPRKRSKTEGMKACQQQIRTTADYARLTRAVEVYAAEIKRLGTPPEKQLHWSTFASGRWTDYADETAARPERDSLWDAMDAEDRARGIVP